MGQRPTVRKAFVKQGVVPRARKPFAIFVQQNSKIPKGSSRSAFCKEMKRLGGLWQALSAEEKAEFTQQSNREFAEQRRSMFSNGLFFRKAKQEGVQIPMPSDGSHAEGLPQDNNATVTLGGYTFSSKSKNFLGSGSYGQVHLACSNDQVLRAVKVFFGQQRKANAVSEAQAYGKLLASVASRDKHHFPDLIEDHSESHSCPFIVLQYGGQALSHFLKQGSDTKVPIMPVAVQLKKAISLVHAAGLLHLDVKPANLLWNEHEHLLKLCDFGMCEPREGEFEPRWNVYVTQAYRAPELFDADSSWTNQQFREALHPAVDVWAYGCVIFEVATQTVLMAPVDRKEHGSRQMVREWCSLSSKGVFDNLLARAQGSGHRALGANLLLASKGSSALIARLHSLNSAAWLKVVLSCCHPHARHLPEL